MTERDMVSKRIEVVEIIDWHDGYIQALITVNWKKGFYLCSLIACGTNLDDRVFALLSLTDLEVEQIKENLMNWNELVLCLKRLWDKATGEVTVLFYSCKNDSVIACTSVEANKLKNQTVSDISETLEENRMKWFDLFQI